MAYAEYVATLLFGDSITSARAGNVADYELMVQTWVLREGRYRLEGEYAAFKEVLNRVTDWTTVKCEGTNFLHDGTTTALPTFVGTKDCAVLSAAFAVADPCTSASCSASEAMACFSTSPQSVCIQHYKDTVCTNSDCDSGFYTVCCTIGCTYACCQFTGAYIQICT